MERSCLIYQRLRRFAAGSQFERLTRSSNRETIMVNAACIEGDPQRPDRIIDRLVGELERAPVMRQRLLRAASLENAHAFFRIDVLFAHEPAWLVSADG